MAEFKDVEDLVVWAFRDQRVEQVASSLRPRQPGWSSSTSVAQVMALGTRVDSSAAGARFLGGRCHEDAAVIYDAVMSLPPEAWREVVKHARTATEPYWYEEGPGYFAVPLDRAGRPKRLWRDPARQKGDLGEAPPELVGTHPVVVEEARAIYRLWHVSLCELVPMLNRELVAHRASLPLRPAEPWNMPARQLHRRDLTGGRSLT